MENLVRCDEVDINAFDQMGHAPNPSLTHSVIHVIPAQAGIHATRWTSACAEVTGFWF
tara:strand:- start:911 stop:1084 length:174 start_codon:yes stop_codon:yes gene_type:complete